MHAQHMLKPVGVTVMPPDPSMLLLCSSQAQLAVPDALPCACARLRDLTRAGACSS